MRGVNFILILLVNNIIQRGDNPSSVIYVSCFVHTNDRNWIYVRLFSCVLLIYFLVQWRVRERMSESRATKRGIFCCFRCRSYPLARIYLSFVSSSSSIEETEKNMIIWIPLIYIWKKEAENATVSGPPQWQWKCIHKHGKMCSRWVVLDCVHVILLPLLLHDLCSGLFVYENTMNNCEEEKLTATLAHLRIDNNKNNEFLFYENRSGDSLSVIRRLLCCCWS